MKSLRTKFPLIVCCTLVSVAAHAQQAASTRVTPAATAATPVTTTGGTRGLLPAFDSPSSVVSSQLYTNLTYGGLGIGRVPAASLDVLGQTIFRGGAVFSRSGDATPSGGKPSFQFQFQTSVYNSNNKGTLIPNFTLQTEPTGNNTPNTGATLNFLYYSGIGSAPGETGLYFNPNGVIHFAPAQTFPITTGATGPQGPQGPAGPQGATGPAGTIALPYVASSKGSYVFYLTNTGTTVGGGIYAQGANGSGQTAGGVGITGGGGVGGEGNFTDGGIGLLGLGGHAGVGEGASGGLGVEGQGAATSAAATYGGSGGHFLGGQGPGGGGFGVIAEGADGLNGGSGGDGIDAYGGAPGNVAGQFYGNVNITGNISKAGGSFKIDHPLDPENKYLSHSFVESPDMMNIYNGNIVTDGRGEAVVTLPDYFEALNRDFSYQLTVIGQFAQAVVGSKIANNVFTVRTDKPDVEVSWQVTGVRQDAWANAHRIPNEEEKKPEEKGHYMHPELFGHANEASIGEMGHAHRPVNEQPQP